MANPTPSLPDTVVICAFGPAATTRAAVLRARRLVANGGEVLVYAGARSGVSDQLRRLEHPRRSDVAVLEEVGRAGLRAALERCGSGPVLFVHDDVVVSLQSARRLVSTAAAGGYLTVAYSNDAGLDTDVGRLPTGHDAVNALARLAADPRLVASSTHRARTTCLAGTAAHLGELGELHLSSPRTLLSSPSRPFLIAANALVAHEGRCGERLLGPEGPDGRPLLVASMIVRDEEAMLADCLASLQGVVDRVEICDTGSTDDTVALARSLGAHVIQRAWRDDFAWARNEALEQCRDAWYVLQIDADERLVCDDAEGLRRRLATSVDDHDAFTVETWHLNDGGNAEMLINAERLFRARGVRFSGAIHESPVAVDGPPLRWSLLEGVRLVHHGYRSEVFAGRGKADRNLTVARADYEAGAGPAAALQYARSLNLVGGDPALQRRLFDEAMHSDLSIPGRALILAYLAELDLHDGEVATALRRAGEALELVPAEDRAAAAYGAAGERLGRPDLVLEMQQRRRTGVSVDALIVSHQHAAQALSREVTALVVFGRFDEAYQRALEAMEVNPANFDAWEPLIVGIAAHHGSRAVQVLLPVLLKDTTGNGLAVAPKVLPAAMTGELCALYSEAGGEHAEAVRVGLVAALLLGRDQLVDRLVPFVGRLDADVVQRIADRAEARGNFLAAAQIRAATLAQRTPASSRS